MNSRAKGMRNELRAQKYYEALGYTILRFYQPPYQDQGPVDMLAIRAAKTPFESNSVILVQVKSNRYGDVKTYQAFWDIFKGAKVSFEICRWDDGVKEPKRRVL